MIFKAEHKIIFFLILLICCIYYAEIIQNLIAQYNESVRLHQAELKAAANNEKFVKFTFCTFAATPLYELLLFLNFFCIPCLFFINIKQSKNRFFYSSSLTFFVFLAYLFWVLHTFQGLKTVESLSSMELNANDSLLYGSNYFDISLFVLLSVLNIWHVFLFSRFIIEKFHNKILLK